MLLSILKLPSWLPIPHWMHFDLTSCHRTYQPPRLAVTKGQGSISLHCLYPAHCFIAIFLLFIVSSTGMLIPWLEASLLSLPVLDSRSSTITLTNCQVSAVKGEALFSVKTGWRGGDLGPENTSGGRSPSKSLCFCFSPLLALCLRAEMLWLLSARWGLSVQF